jgi:hypothetical protein
MEEEEMSSMDERRKTDLWLLWLGEKLGGRDGWETKGFS